MPLTLLQTLAAPFRRPLSFHRRSGSKSTVTAPRSPDTAKQVATPSSAAKALIGNAGGIPVVDFSGFLDGSAKLQTSRAILNSFKRFGFVYLRNYGMPTEKVDEMFDNAQRSKKFFALPMEVKMLAPHPGVPHINRGYVAPGVEKFTQSNDSEEVAQMRNKEPDLIENFSCGHDESVLGKNIWLPEGVLPGFNEACQDFYWKCYEVEISILRAVAIGLGIPEDHLAKSHSGRDQSLRLMHYPAVPAKKLVEGEMSRIGAHSDFSSITLLFQDDVGGLEVEHPDRPGEFMSVPPVPGAVMVNAGDFLQRWSNDQIRSALHRVRAPPGMTDGMTPDRYSIPYFCSTDFDLTVDCLPGTYSDSNPKKYEPITAGEYIQQRLASLYAK
ncbi:thymine dioxygenase [Polyporus arcularius HHB13444]|uniref:Thymine dioxygenase n=1 Tax=Polyporus arcularius HHB13444 TaxID=1314778 RepID=A0A5C3P373_9APHY|nr:thymine dioxygenase [Polyporus arcularius HHB13444]